MRRKHDRPRRRNDAFVAIDFRMAAGEDCRGIKRKGRGSVKNQFIWIDIPAACSERPSDSYLQRLTCISGNCDLTPVFQFCNRTEN